MQNFQEFKLFNRINEDEFNKKRKAELRFKKSEIESLKKKLSWATVINQVGDFGVIISNKFATIIPTSANNRDGGIMTWNISVNKLPDEWYIINYSSHTNTIAKGDFAHIKYYMCDGEDGLLQFLKIKRLIK